MLWVPLQGLAVMGKLNRRHKAVVSLRAMALPDQPLDQQLNQTPPFSLKMMPRAPSLTPVKAMAMFSNLCLIYIHVLSLDLQEWVQWTKECHRHRRILV